MMKVLNTLGIEGNFFNLIKKDKKPTAKRLLKAPKD